MHSKAIDPEEAVRILREETPQRIERLRRKFRELKEQERGQSVRDSERGPKQRAA